MEIAKLADVPQPLIYFHFANKVGLWKACAEFTIVSTLERQEIVTKQLHALPPEQALEYFLKSLVQRAHDHPDTARFYMRAGIEQELDPTLDLGPAYTRGVELFRDNVTYLQDAGVLPTHTDPTLMSYILFGSAMQLYWNAWDFERLTGHRAQTDSVLEAHVDALIRIFSTR